MNKIAAALAALRYGSSLSDPAAWKERQNTINALAGLIGAALVFFPMGLSDEDIRMLATGGAVLLGLVNVYLTTASSDKVGLPDNRQPADRPADGADGDGLDDPRSKP